MLGFTRQENDRFAEIFDDSEDIVMHCVRDGRVETIVWLTEIDLDEETNAMSWACTWRDLDLIKQMRARGCSWGYFTISYAARGGHLDVVKWLVTTDCPPGDDPLGNAVLKGHLEVAKFLRSEGFPFNDETFKNACASGNFQVIKWLIDNGCPWNKKKAISTANSMRKREIARWLQRNLPP